MSTNGVNVAEDADMAECEEEKVVTMMDVLQEQQEFEDDANAVLGASDDKNCTYAKGYIKRQAIYACLTCCVDAKIDPAKRAGVCLACSLNCHENHELIELYTKRNFRCDCGNPKFNNNPCQFVPDKPDLNDENSYNQNFSGLYCTCHRPYPDPEATFEDEMIQCIVCEDWLHAAHLEAALPTSDYAEMVCKSCMENNEFLHSYSDIAVNSESEDVDILTADNTFTECNGVIEKVVGSVDFSDSQDNTNRSNIEMAEADKLDQVSTDNGTDAPKESVEEKVDPIVAVASSDNNLEETKVPDAPQIDSSETNNESSNTDNNTEPISENKEESVKEDIESAENLKEDNSDENSIIESIEKLENELGKVEPKISSEENKTSEQTEGESHAVETDKKETEDSILVDKSADTDSKINEFEESHQETTQNKENDVEMNNDGNSNELESNSIVDKQNGNEEALINTESSSSKDTPELTDSDVITESSTKDTKRKLSTEESEDTTSKKAKLDESCCVRPKGSKRKFKGATFWPSNFRQKLCTCNDCISMYKDLSVLFLMDPEDTVTAYEALGRQKIDGTATSQYEKGLEALTSLDRIQQINALTEYNKMRDKLLDYLKSFKDRKEIVKEEDIKAFFAGMKPKRESDGVYFCR